MRTTIFLGLASALLLVPAAADAAVIKYTATLNGAQEVPPVTTTATGTATLNFDDTARTLTGNVTFTGIKNGDVTMDHIHTGACGTAGPVAQTLAAPNKQKINVNVTLTQAQATDLAAGNLYVNIHTTANNGGEIRGQIFPDGAGKTCPVAAGDGGADASAEAGSSSGSSGSSSGTSGSSGSSGTSSGTSGSNGATTTPADDAGTGDNGGGGDDGGCSTTGSTDGSGLAVLLGVGVAVAALSRGRARKKR